MKVRKGFVSNSSSSSFVVMIENDEFKKVLKECHPYIKRVIEKIGYDNKRFLEKDIVIISTFEGMGGDGTLDYIDVNQDHNNLYYIDVDNDDYEYYKSECEEGEEPLSSPRDAFNDFLNLIDDDKHVTHSGYN